MSVGLLLITHDEVGRLLLQTAETILGQRPLSSGSVAVKNNHDCDQLQQEAIQQVTRLDQGQGVLVLTDLFGSTPANIATKLQQEGRVNVLSGVNLPMVLKIFNYASLDLEELTAKALSGGQQSIRLCHPKPQVQ
jgi:PTS system ascorbate-specific IIA component